ncbi:MAG TPA: outer membrane beta-barrel protein [Candidatus Acidoferrales bacterium]|nr:outer membrane beta-barrel protein [Candidatus Acidoferrales bacterium]
MESRNATGVAALLVGLGAVMAQAQDYSYLPPDAGPVFRMGIGPSFFENGELTQFGVPVSSPVTYQPGVAFDAAFGWAFNRYVALDFESGYIGARIDNVPGYTSDDSYLYNIPFLANVTLSCPIPHTNLIPYAGAGVGGADVVFDTDQFGPNLNNFVTGGASDVVLAGQAFAGLRFRLTRNLSLDLGYKFFATDDPTFTYPPDNFNVSFRGARTHSVLFALFWNF